ncbi:unnamed protein product [Rhizophagus irregularis]|nr:unnamed protein product [Rhizophagus irregularis]
MNVTEDPEYDNICTKCNQKIMNYPNKLCRKQFLPPRITSTYEIQNSGTNNFFKLLSENLKLDEFIKETQLNSKYCDDFIEWIPSSNLENIKHLANGGSSKVYFGIWNLSSNMSLAPVIPKQVTCKVVLKSINGSDNISDLILNELKFHHECRGPRVIPFYGITKSPHSLDGNKYAMIIRHAEYGDLRNYIYKFFPKLTWIDRAKILLELSKALNSLHQMNLLHRDFHCKNILVDEGDRIFVSDFGLCQLIGSEIDTNNIQGVLPYIAPEVLRHEPYTKRSEVYSISMIMWELTSKKPPFSNYPHNIELAFAVLDGQRPEDVKGTPYFYANIMKQCWDSDPLKRPDASCLPEIFEKMIEQFKMTDDNVSSNSTSCSLSSRSNSVNNDNIESGYKTRAYSLSLTCKTNDADIEISPLPPVANLNEISIQAEYETKKHENISGFSTNFNGI